MPDPLDPPDDPETTTPACRERQSRPGPLLDWLFAETVDQAPVSISITDANANIVYVNRAFTEITGYAPEESLGHNESMLSDKRTPATVYESLWAALHANNTWHGYLVNRHKDGHRYLADLAIAPILNQQGKVTHYIGMHRDITDVYRLEQQVLNQKVLIETVVNCMPVATVLLDESDRVVLDNQMYKALSSDLGIKEPARVFLEILREEMGEEWQRLKQKGIGFRNRELRFDRGGSRPPRWYACAGSWFTHGDDSIDAFFNETQQTYLLLTLSDLTLQKKHEAEMRLNAMRALMAEDEKIQSVKETLSAAIHHIQGPLNLLTAARTMLLRRGQEQQNATLREILDQILDAGKDSIEQLKNCCPEPPESAMAPVNLNQLLHEAIILLTDRLLANGVVVDWKPTPVLPAMMGLEHRLRAMIKQLIDNAIDAMSHNGIGKRELHISTWSDEELIHVCIGDTGHGIPENMHIKVFEPFFSTKQGGGQHHSGMGLTMAQEVINQHLGLIRFESIAGEGCRVHIQFTIHRQHVILDEHSAHA